MLATRMKAYFNSSGLLDPRSRHHKRPFIGLYGQEMYTLLCFVGTLPFDPIAYPLTFGTV